MPYRYLDNIAVADIAIEVTGSSLEELFREAGLALENEMVDLNSLNGSIEKKIYLAHPDAEQLLYNFLEELVVIKDSEQFLAKTITVTVRNNSLVATLTGELIDPSKHGLRNDIKAITYHKFKLEKLVTSFQATFVLDL